MYSSIVIITLWEWLINFVMFSFGLFCLAISFFIISLFIYAISDLIKKLKGEKV